MSCLYEEDVFPEHEDERETHRFSVEGPVIEGDSAGPYYFAEIAYTEEDDIESDKLEIKSVDLWLRKDADPERFWRSGEARPESWTLMGQALAAAELAAHEHVEDWL